MIAFDRFEEFRLAPFGQSGVLYQLSAAGRGGPHFIAADPASFFPDYAVEVCDSDVKELGLEDVEDVLVLVLVTRPVTADGVPTANLMGPVVINRKNGRAAQVVFEDGRYTARAPLAPVA
jgi:flagellar assembly factor FliW